VHMMGGGSMLTLQKLDREFQRRQAQEAAEQKRLDQQNAIEQERKANFDDLQDEMKQQLSTSLLSPGADDAVADAPALDIDSMLLELEVQKNQVEPKIEVVKTLKDATGSEHEKDGEKKVNYDLAHTISNVIYHDKINIADLIPAQPNFSDIKKLLIAEIIKANLKLFNGYTCEGMDLILDAQLDRPTLFAIFFRLHDKICKAFELTEDAIDFYKMHKDKLSDASKPVSLNR
jgi:hypothetical protein